MDEPHIAVGKKLGEARRAMGISKREASRRAGIAEITWRQYEAGERQVTPGMKVPVNPDSDKLEAAALAVHLDPAPLFELLGRPYAGAPAPARSTLPAELEEGIAGLREAMEVMDDRLRALRAAIQEPHHAAGSAGR
jgi:transcriptional regulator with XRE-family HTH domain